MNQYSLPVLVAEARAISCKGKKCIIDTNRVTINKGYISRDNICFHPDLSTSLYTYAKISMSKDELIQKGFILPYSKEYSDISFLYYMLHQYNLLYNNIFIIELDCMLYGNKVCYSEASSIYLFLECTNLQTIDRLDYLDIQKNLITFILLLICIGVPKINYINLRLVDTNGITTGYLIVNESSIGYSTILDTSLYRYFYDNIDYVQKCAQELYADYSVDELIKGIKGLNFKIGDNNKLRDSILMRFESLTKLSTLRDILKTSTSEHA